MVFNGNGMVIGIFFVLLAWLGGLSFIVFRMVGHYNRLTGGKENVGVKEILENLLTTQKGLRSEQRGRGDSGVVGPVEIHRRQSGFL